MNATPAQWNLRGALLAINLLFLMVWGFTSLGKFISGKPPWFDDKFRETILAKVPGLTPSFWLLAGAELVAFLMALGALGRGEFLEKQARDPWLLKLMLVWSLFVFVMLGFGQWLTSEFNGTAQLFSYFAGTVVCLHYVTSRKGY